MIFISIANCLTLFVLLLKEKKNIPQIFTYHARKGLELILILMKFQHNINIFIYLSFNSINDTFFFFILYDIVNVKL